MKKKDRSKFHHFAILDLPFDQCVKRIIKFYRYDDNVEMQPVNEDQYILTFRRSGKQKPFATAQIMRWEGTFTRLTMHINDRQGLPHINRYMLFTALFVLVLFLMVGMRYLTVANADSTEVALLFVITGVIAMPVFAVLFRAYGGGSAREGKIWSNLLIALSPDGLGKVKE